MPPTIDRMFRQPLAAAAALLLLGPAALLGGCTRIGDDDIAPAGLDPVPEPRFTVDVEPPEEIVEPLPKNLNRSQDPYREAAPPVGAPALD